MNLTPAIAPPLLPLGPVMVDVVGYALTEIEIARLQHPLVGGVILFARNYANPTQLAALTSAIHAVRSPPLMIAVDHEGGRVQRFREGFTAVPPMRMLGEQYDHAPDAARNTARAIGVVIASELMAHGIDFSFTPVLDLDWGSSGVIGNRAFHAAPAKVSVLAGALIAGLAEVGMASVGKHYPGHGYVRADSHLEVPVDTRSLAEIEADDLLPFRDLSQKGMTAVMPAHVIYPAVDDKPAGFSRIWLDKLRQELAFDGVIFSDDLTMEGARVAGDVVQCGAAALQAGCDMVLVCNDPARADALLAGLDTSQMPQNPHLARRLAMMAAKLPGDRSLLTSEAYQSACQTLRSFAAV